MNSTIEEKVSEELEDIWREKLHDILWNEKLYGDEIDIRFDTSEQGHNKGKIVIGLCGYAASGKDTIGKILVEEDGFFRVSFGDLLKEVMNKYVKEEVSEHLLKSGIELAPEEIDFLTENRDIKEKIRPYIISFGEFVRQSTGKYVWINKALEQTVDHDKLVITDVRRITELEIFDEEHFSSALFLVNKKGNKDSDTLTKDCILRAIEDCYFKDIINVKHIDDEEERVVQTKRCIGQMKNNCPEFF